MKIKFVLFKRTLEMIMIKPKKWWPECRRLCGMFKSNKDIVSKLLLNPLMLGIVLCAGVPEAGAPPELRHFLVRQAGAGVWVISSSSG